MAKIAKARGRSVQEWIGATADSRPPKHVLLRIFDRDDGRCYLTGRKIVPGDVWDAEHVIRLEDGGENRESNMRPALKDPHKIKSAQERAAAVPVTRRRETHVGLKDAARNPIRSPGFPRVERENKSTRPAKALPFRPMFR